MGCDNLGREKYSISLNQWNENVYGMRMKRNGEACESLATVLLKYQSVHALSY